MAPLHILAGSLGLIGGAIALCAAKGANLHRTSGLTAVYALLIMSVTGVWLAISRHIEANTIGGVLAGYLVFTALRTVKLQTTKPGWPDATAMTLACAFGLTCITAGFATLAAGKGKMNGVPVPILLVFGSVALLASYADWRWIRSTGNRNDRRVVRHLWRMCFGLFIASASFFLGPDSRVPQPMRIPALRAVLGFLPLVVMLYWLARLRRQKSLNSLISIRRQNGATGFHS